MNITTPLKKGLGMHIQMKNRISQPDGMDDSCVEDSEEDDMVNLVLGGGDIWCTPHSLFHTQKSFTLRLALASKKRNIP